MPVGSGGAPVGTFRAFQAAAKRRTSGELKKKPLPQGLKPTDFAGFMYGLKPVPFKTER
jgi:hypothetical protein